MLVEEEGKEPPHPPWWEVESPSFSFDLNLISTARTSPTPSCFNPDSSRFLLLPEGLTLYQHSKHSDSCGWKGQVYVSYPWSSLYNLAGTM